MITRMSSIVDEFRIFPSKARAEKLCLANPDKNHCISSLAFIFQLEPKLVLPDELNKIVLNTYQCLKKVNFLDPLKNVLVLLKAIETEKCVIIDETFKISLRDCWFCTLVILASLKHCNQLFKNDSSRLIDIYVVRKFILQQALATFRPDRYESIHLLRLISSLATIPDNDPDSTIAVDLVCFARTVALSPLNGFRQHAENISKRSMDYASAQQRLEFLDVDFLPLKGVSIKDLGYYFPRLDINSLLFQQIVTRIIEMFSNNIENREGNLLYKILLNIVQHDFDTWKQVIWPQFFNKFRVINDCEGEFFQSLLKYWIPTTVASLESKLYHFVSRTSLPDLLKGYILLETRKRFLLKACKDNDLQFLNALFSQEKTRNLAFQIVCCYFKKTDVPSIPETRFVTKFCYEQSGVLNHEESHALDTFLRQIVFVIANKGAEEELLEFLKGYLFQTFIYGVSILKTSRRCLGAQILITLCNATLNENVPLGTLKQFKPKDKFFMLLNHLKSDSFLSLVEQTLMDSRGLEQELSKLASKVIVIPAIFTNEFLMWFIDQTCNVLSIQASESVKNVTQFIVSVSTKENINNLHEKIIRALMSLFETDWSITETDPKDIFKATLLFEALNQVSNHMSGKTSNVETWEWILTVCFPAVALLLQQEYYQPEQNSPVMSEECLSVKRKMEKIVEAFYNNLCQYLLSNRSIWALVDKPRLIKALIRIIEHSSMRKPTMLSADLLKHTVILIDKEVRGLDRATQDVLEMQALIDEENRKQNMENFKLNLLSQTLQKLEQIPSVQNLSIRRNPETRLVLHALCISDSSPQKYILTWTLNHLLETLSNKTSTPATTSAALHCTEILMSDNSLYSHTIKYAPRVILQCISHFENRNWVVRNACIQLTKALIERFLGVLKGRNNRFKSVDDLFQLFPQIALPFFQIVTEKPLTDSALAVMQFFSESQLNKQPYSTEISNVTREAFLQGFVVLIKENSHLYGVFAVRAYVSLCLEHCIPYLIQHIVDFIVGNFEYIRRRHTVRNFMLLLQELYDKYIDFLSDKPAKPEDFYRVQESFHQLTLFLKHLDLKQFDCLLVKVLSLQEALRVLQRANLNLEDYHQRVWLQNYVPFLVINSSVPDLPVVLRTILPKDVPECLQVKVLSILVDRFVKEHKLCSEANEILNILMSKALDVDNSRKYLLMCYFKVILLLFEECQGPQFNDFDCLLHKMRQSYASTTKNTYKIFIFLLVLTMVQAKTNSDKALVKSAVKHFQNLDYNDEDLTKSASEMLRYLYKNSFCLCDRRRVIKLALFLIVEHGLWHFVTFITKSNIPTPIGAMRKLLDFHFLTKFFGSDLLAFEFVKAFYTSVISQDNTDIIKCENKTYYAEEECVFVDRDCIGRIVAKFVYEFCKFRKIDWLEFVYRGSDKK